MPFNEDIKMWLANKTKSSRGKSSPVIRNTGLCWVLHMYSCYLQEQRTKTLGALYHCNYLEKNESGIHVSVSRDVENLESRVRECRMIRGHSHWCMYQLWLSHNHMYGSFWPSRVGRLHA